MSHAPRNDRPAPSGLSTAARWGLLLLLLLTWGYSLFGSEGILTQRRRHREVERLQARVEVERERNVALAAEVNGLRDDDFVIERAIRTELDYVRPGEIVLVVGDDDPLAAPNPGAGTP